MLRGVDLDIEPGRLIGIIGESGAGKSTLLRILAGEIHPDQGHSAMTGTLGYCPQRLVMDDDLTVEQHLRFFRRAYRAVSLDRAGELCVALGVEAHLHTCVGLLSRTIRQKLNVVLALMHNPEIVLFDEPYQCFDRRDHDTFWTIVDMVRAAGTAIVIAGHLAREPQRFDQVFTLHGGRLTSAETQTVAEPIIARRATTTRSRPASLA